MEKYNQTSSGRWDATGSWEEAVEKEKREARLWSYGLSRQEIVEKLIEMAEDPNAYTTYERRALLLLAAEMIDF